MRYAKVVLKERGLTQKWLAKKIGVHPATLSAHLNNHREYNPMMVAKIIRALDITETYLFLGHNGIGSVQSEPDRSKKRKGK